MGHKKSGPTGRLNNNKGGLAAQISWVLIVDPDLDISPVCQKAGLPSVRLGKNFGSQRETWVMDGVTAAKSFSDSQDTST